MTHDKIRSVSAELLAAFESGSLPAALAQALIHRHVEAPSRKWTWANRVLALRRNHCYAGGFRQWEALGRHVCKGQKAFHILVPRFQKQTEPTGEELSVLKGFLLAPDFGYGQAQGTPLPGAEDEARFVDALPLVEVARSWGLVVSTFSFGEIGTKLGLYAQGRIQLATENLSTWAHELVHAADDQLGMLRESDLLDKEVVAEFGSAVLLECLGFRRESDRGGAFDYINHFCQNEAPGRTPWSVCSALLDRVCSAVGLLLDHGDRLQATRLEAPSASVAA